MIDQASFEEFKDPETYDLVCDRFDADMPFIQQWAKTTGGPLLDLACGTGRMAIHMALRGYQVTGVDIVPEMIAKAKQKAADRGASVDFVVSDARDFHLNKQFPLVFMLMNAFQFLLEREDHEGMLACVSEHLLPDGYFLFETRNPIPKMLFEVRHPHGERYTTADGGQVSITDEASYDPMTQIQHYITNYQFHYADGRHEERTNYTSLRYVFPQEMESLLHYNGFKIHTVYGSWDLDPLTPDSPAMIYVCQKGS